jgi:hypothetical protein
MTTPTAIMNLNSTAEDRSGSPVTTKFGKWIEDGNKSGLFVVLDEAHHAPAYGCRHLLIGSDEATPGIRKIVKRKNLALKGDIDIGEPRRTSRFLVFAVARKKAGELVLWLRFRFCRLKLRIAELPEHKSEHIR